MKAVLDFVVARGTEPSTWAGLAGVAGAVGISQPVYGAIAAALTAVCSLVAVFLKEQKAS